MDEGEIPKTNADAKPPKTWALKAGLILMGLGALAFLYVVFAATSKPDTSSYARFATGSLSRLAVLEAAPGLPGETIRDAAGQETDLAGLLAASSGKPMLVNLWATWCAPCVAELPTLGGLARRYQGRLQVVTVNVDELSLTQRAETMLARARRRLAAVLAGLYPRDPILGPGAGHADDDPLRRAGPRVGAGRWRGRLGEPGGAGAD